MTDKNVADGQPYAVAKNEIHLWRSACIDEFCKAERAVGSCLTKALEVGLKTRIRRQAGLRLDDLQSLAGTVKGTQKQKVALESALQSWREVESRRVFFAHGCAQEFLDKRGQWVAMLTMVTGTAKRPDETRWTVTQEEAAQFQERLCCAFRDLSQQLGQLRARLEA